MVKIVLYLANLHEVCKEKRHKECKSKTLNLQHIKTLKQFLSLTNIKSYINRIGACLGCFQYDHDLYKRRSSARKVFLSEGVLKICNKLTGKQNLPPKYYLLQ